MHLHSAIRGAVRDQEESPPFVNRIGPGGVPRILFFGTSQLSM